MDKTVAVALISVFGGGMMKILYDLIKQRRSKAEPFNLKRHVFFSRMNYFIEVFIPTKLVFTSELKQQALRQALDVKFKVFYDIYRDEVALPCTECGGYTASDRINVIVGGVHKYEARWKELGLPQIFIDRFTHWHSSHVELIVARLEDVWDSRYYKTYEERLGVEMLLVLSAFEMTIVDVEKTLVELNGEIDNALKDRANRRKEDV